ncbi:MAG TPA: hypothetical protein VGG90_00235 [Candidatus Dormibacteraeota bacterium]|jgi:hypothetical protein
MARLIRNPLTWMVIAEVVVVAALGMLAWSAFASAVKPALASPSLAPAAAADAPTSSPLPDLPAGQPGGHGPAPGLNVDAFFWRDRLDALNHDQVFFEQLEWKLIHTAMGAAQRYVETVVLPSIQRAERP